jgi:hypothetical protein
LSGAGISSITTNGREIFLGVAGSGAGPTVMAFDCANPSATLHPCVGARSGIYLPAAMALGPDGDLLLVDYESGVRRFDPDSRALSSYAPAPPGRLHTGSYNPWTREFGANSDSSFVVFDEVAGAWRQQVGLGALANGVGVTGIAPMCEQPFQLFGSGCTGAGGVEPRMRWTGLPLRGATCRLTLRHAGSAGFALCLLGASRTTSALGSLPLPLGAFGAPGCALRVSPDIALLQPVAAGGAVLPIAVPNSPSLAGALLFGQWVLPAPVNAAGMVTTEGVMLRVR